MTPVRLIAQATLEGLPRGSLGARETREAQWAMLPAHGISGVLAWSDWAAIRAAGLVPHAMGRLDSPDDAESLLAAHVDAGVASTTLHVGTAFDEDDTLDRFAGALLEASVRRGHRVLLETHRATVTQDPWRTLRWVERFPDLRFSLDASHWVVGGELDYGGGFSDRLPLFDPVLRRSPMVQGRIASGGAIQVAVNDPGPWQAHATALWTRAFALRRHEAPNQAIAFCPELLPHVAGDAWFGYAPVCRRDDAPHGLEETTDRFAEALRLFDLADACAVSAVDSPLEPSR
ncbi:hypothetical protein [Silanimonas sp.]|uniref:hypothetical protein n=1 Tax=Silanimonas sp. TaxID=1929290 RepID=UPI0022BE1D40|nr:hypothetical protein [Silanimonas sp.]MCZ8165584.1 hypothetical protein [Silanimonas sp.]